MLGGSQSTETSQERTAEPGPEKQSQTVLKMLRYPDKSEYRIRYKDGERVVTKEGDDR